MFPVSVAVLSLSGAAFAQDERDFSTYAPVAAPTRIDNTAAPRIDGILDDAAWEQATALTEFYQVEPVVGATPSEKTIVYLTYDEDALYVGVKAYDRDPSAIKTTILERDGDVWRDDMIRFYIDPYDTGISGFGFDVNALGARGDRLVQANRRPVDEWDTIWDSAGRVTEDGWEAEFTIPFRSISFDPDGDGWGMMITREITHKNEEVRWAGIDRSVNKFGFTRPGRLVGIQDVNQGSGFDLELLGGIEFNREWEQPRSDEVTFNPSANLYYKFSPSLTGLFTLNSDFSDTPLDSPEVNTGQFALFRPETRDFFLQDAAFFEFGGESFNGAPNGRPFFSRRIGLVDGQPVTIDAGAKLSGDLGGVKIGALTTLMEETATTDAQLLSVVRATKTVLDQSRIGMIATHGDPTGATDNSVVGVDFLYREPSFLGAGLFQTDLFYQKSYASDRDDDDSYGVRLSYPNDRWNWKVEARTIGEDFRPALGFVNRPGTVDYSTSWRRRSRSVPNWLRFVDVGTEHQLVTDLSGNVESEEHVLAVELQTGATDEAKFFLFEAEETVAAAFDLPRGINVPAGTYSNSGYALEWTPARVRSYGIGVGYSSEDFFGGTRDTSELRLVARPSPYFNISATYEREDIQVPGGDVLIHIGTADVVVNVSPDVSISTQLQYDNISEVGALFSRLRWEIRPETEVFVSVGHGAFIEEEDFPQRFRSVESSMIFRIGNRFRF